MPASQGEGGKSSLARLGRRPNKAMRMCVRVAWSWHKVCVWAAVVAAHNVCVWNAVVAAGGGVVEARGRGAGGMGGGPVEGR